MLSKERMLSAFAGMLLSLLATSSQGADTKGCRQDYLQIYGICVHAPFNIVYERYRANGVDVHWQNYSELEGGTGNVTEVPTIHLTVNGQDRGKKLGSQSPIPLDGLQTGVTYRISLCATYPNIDFNAYCTNSTVNIPKVEDPAPTPTSPTTPTEPPRPRPPTPVYETPESPKVLSVESVGNEGSARLRIQCGKHNNLLEASFVYNGPGIGNGDDFFFLTRLGKNACPVNTQQEFIVPFASKPAGNWSYRVWARNGNRISPLFHNVLGSFLLAEHALINPNLPLSVAGTKPVIRDVQYKVANYDQIGFGVVYAAAQASECEPGDAFHNVYKACMRMNLPDSYWRDFTPNYAIGPNVNIFQIDTSTVSPSVFYTAIGSACPYGGSRRDNRCQVATFSHVALNMVINPSHNFWLDDNQNWPGLYSKKIQGVCPYGGIASTTDDGCTIAALPDMRPGPYWWIDSSPSYRGIYYSSDDRNCYLGGIYLGEGCRLYEFIGAFAKPGHGFPNLSNVEFELFQWGQDLALSYQTVGKETACYYGRGEKVGSRCVIQKFPGVAASAWIDINPSWPGVYYKAVNDQCVYGGSYGGGNCMLYRFTQPAPGTVVPPAPNVPDEKCGKPDVCRWDKI